MKFTLWDALVQNLEELEIFLPLSTCQISNALGKMHLDLHMLSAYETGKNHVYLKGKENDYLMWYKSGRKDSPTVFPITFRKKIPTEVTPPMCLPKNSLQWVCFDKVTQEKRESSGSSSEFLILEETSRVRTLECLVSLDIYI